MWNTEVIRQMCSYLNLLLSVYHRLFVWVSNRDLQLCANEDVKCMYDKKQMHFYYIHVTILHFIEIFFVCARLPFKKVTRAIIELLLDKNQSGFRLMRGCLGSGGSRMLSLGLIDIRKYQKLKNFTFSDLKKSKKKNNTR